MRNTWILCKRELKSYFTTPIAYVFIAAFLLLTGLCTFYVGDFFAFQPWIYALFIPVITMRLWAEERRSGTMELLLTLPISTWEAVSGKFLAALLFIAITLSLTIPLWIAVNYFSTPNNYVILSSYFGSLLLAAAFLSIGSCVSALTKNQIIAFIVTLLLLVLINLLGLPLVVGYIRAWMPSMIFASMCSGVIELSSIIYFATLITFNLFVNTVVIDEKQGGNMLNKKTLTKLLVITTLCAVPVIAIMLKPGNLTKDNIVFLPNLLVKPDNVARLIIQDHEHTLTLQRSDNGWEIAERNNFPVLHDKVEELLFGLADMRIIEPKTSDPLLYGQLDVNDIADENSHALLVTVQDKQQQDLVKLLIGKREGLRNGEDYFEHIFVRKVDDVQAWLVKGLLPISNDIKDWVDQPLLSIIDEQKIKQFRINKPQGDNLIIAKKIIEQEDFVLETSQAKPGMVLDIDAINTLPFEVAELEFSDVIAVDAQELDWSKSILAELETFSGVTVALNVMEHNGTVLGRVRAHVAADAATDLQQQVAEFNASKERWYYQLPAVFYKAITVGNADLLKTGAPDNHS